MLVTIKPIIIFDFDKTLVETDTDAWVISWMDLIPLYNKWRGQLPWIPLMNMLLAVLHSQGKTVDDIVECLKMIPMDPQIKLAIRTAQLLGCDLKIVSNANTFYIETILKKHGLYDCFSEIISNVAEVTGEGKLEIIPYPVLFKANSKCVLCPPMCKGSIIQRMQKSLGKQYYDQKVRFIYVGEKSADYCPTLKLEKWDFVMPRKNSPLYTNICGPPSLVEATINEWNTGEQFLRILISLIDTITPN